MCPIERTGNTPTRGLAFPFRRYKDCLAPLDFKPPALKAFSPDSSCEKALSHGREGLLGRWCQHALHARGLSGCSELGVQRQEEAAEEERKDRQSMAETHPQEETEE